MRARMPSTSQRTEARGAFPVIMNEPQPNEEIDLAELQQAVLDDGKLGELLTDIEALCTIHRVMLKASADAYTDDGARSIRDVRPALEQGMAVQLRYAYRGEDWCDTLLPGVSGTLLVRMRERSLPAGIA